MEIFENIMSRIVVPIILIAILYVLTAHLLVERDKLTRDPAPAPYTSGMGVGIPVQLLIEQWSPYYGGGEGVDEVIAKNEHSLRISTAADGGWYGARGSITDASLNDTAIAFSIRVHDWEEVDRYMVLFSSGVDFANYYGINLKNYFSNPANEEWIDVILELSEFDVIEGNPDWDTVTDVALRIVPTPGVATRVWFDELTTIDSSRQKGMVTLTFDDGFKSVRDAENIMTMYGMTGTAYVIPELLDTDDYMTQLDVDHLASNGWDIAGHGKDNLTTLSAPEVDTHLAAMTEYLSVNNYQGRHHFAYPNGAYNRSVQSQVLEYFQSARTIDGFHQSPEYIYPYNVNAVTISSSTPVAEIVEQINIAEASGSWLILVWHDVNTNPVSDVEYNVNDFEWIVEYLSEADVQVAPYSVALAKMLNPVNTN